MKTSVLLIFLFIILIPLPVTSILLTPIEKQIVYYPGITEDTCDFSIQTKYDTTVSFKINGDLNESIRLNKSDIVYQSGKWYSIGCKINIPQDINPGLHKARIVAIEGGSSGGGVSAVAGIEYPVTFFIPYPGKYLEITSFRPKDIVLNTTQDFSITVVNRGKENLDSVIGTIQILQGDTEIGRVETQKISITTSEPQTLTAIWDNKGIEPGQYTAKATVNYDGKEVIDQRDFKIGDIRIDIIDINPLKIKKDTIAKFNLELKSLWNLKIEDAHISLIIFDKNNKEVRNIIGENFAIGPWDILSKQIFLDAKDLPIGNYLGNFTIFHSNGRAAEKQITLKIEENYFSAYPIIIILVLIILILIIAFAYYSIKRKNEKTI